MADREPKHMLEALEDFGVQFLGLYALVTVIKIKETIENGEPLSLQEGSELERIYEHYCQP